MKSFLVIGLLLAAGDARADAFGFKNHDGFEKCMQLDHLIETEHTTTGSETRVLAPEEIQPRCVAAAVKLVVQTKDAKLAGACIETTKRLSAPEQALDLIGALVDLSLPACNDIENYAVLLRPLSDGYVVAPYLAKSTGVIKRCLKDKDFRKDFLEEKDSGDETRAANACKILLGEKLVSACKGHK